jgi:hypothetical protein
MAKKAKVQVEVVPTPSVASISSPTPEVVQATVRFFNKLSAYEQKEVLAKLSKGELVLRGPSLEILPA